jgi:hypothetical protein
MEEVTIVITACNRPDLLEITINSFLQYNTYPIKQWIISEDSGNPNINQKLEKKFPEFMWITGRRGQIKSIDEAYSHVKTEYVFHLEDDWVFLTRRNYIGNSIRLLKDNNGIGQVLFNRNYAELVKDYAIEGGQVVAGGKYRIHEHQMPPKYKISCEYWAHFSFRPSIIRREVFDIVGAFNEVKHFEMDYAQRY